VKHGPVDVVIVASADPKIDGSILAELERLAGQGTIRVLDAMILVKDEDGNRASIDIDELGDEDKAALGFIETGTRGMFDSADAETLWEGMVPGSVVAALAIEHVWAIDLVNAIQNAGAELAFNWRVPAPIVDDAFASIGM
jgi:hypothetical protein